MRFTKIAITAATLVGIGVPAGLAISIAADSRPVVGSDRFLLKFNDQNDPDGSKRKYQAWLQGQLNEVMTDYKKLHPEWKGLKLDYITLNNNPPIDYFNNVNRSVQALNKELSFNLILRSPVSLGDGFYRRNTDMLNFYWSPDYNGVGTWLQYLFTDSFGLPNMWEPLSQLINNLNDNGDVVVNKNVVFTNDELSNNSDNQNWVIDLAKYLESFKVQYFQPQRDAQGQIVYLKKPDGSNGDPRGTIKYLNVVNSSVVDGKTKYHAITNEEAIKTVSANLDLDTGTFYQSIANGIASWADSNNKVEGTLIDYESLDEKERKSKYILKDIYNKTQNGGIELESYKPSKTIQLVNWLSSYNPVMPYYQNGPFSFDTYLRRYGAHTPVQDASTGQDFMDWWYNPDTYKKPGTYKNPLNPSDGTWTDDDQKEYNSWVQASPFESHSLPYNQTFTEVPNSYFSSQLVSSLFRWMMEGDLNRFDHSKDEWNRKLTNCLSLLSVDDFAKFIDNGFANAKPDNSNRTTVPISGQADTDGLGGGYIDIPIRPIQWVDSNGKTVPGKFVSPEDLWAGFEGYIFASEINYAQNAYFIDMLKLDTKRTLGYAPNKERNNSLSDKKTFRIYFHKPELAGRTIADILSSQFFSAMPAFSPLVKNYTDPTLRPKYVVLAKSGELDPTATKFDQIYGGGNPYESWKSLYYCSPYFVSNVNEQEIDYKINKVFYQNFADDGTAKDGEHKTFNLTGTAFGGSEKTKRFERINYRYAGSFNPRITYEEFKRGSQDNSALAQADRAEALAGAEELINAKTEAERDAVFKKHPMLINLWNQKNTKNTQSDLISYNPSIYVNNANGSVKLYNSKTKQGLKQDDPVYQQLSTDKWGNTVFPDGYEPEVKSKVTPGYADLIVKNMATPIDARDENGNLLPALQRSSAIIRTAISNLINWYSIIFTVNPIYTLAIQNSAIPYGEFSTNPNNGNLRYSYWSLASYKVVNEKQKEAAIKKAKALIPGVENGLGYLPGGLMQWSLPELVQQWKDLFNKK